MSVASIYEPIKDGLELVEKRLKFLSNVEFPWVSVPLSYVLDSGGKRIRPVLTLLSGKFYNYDVDRLVTMGLVQTTCLPASRAAMQCSAWSASGE